MSSERGGSGREVALETARRLRAMQAAAVAVRTIHGMYHIHMNG